MKETKQTAVDILFDRIKLKADSIPMNNKPNRLIKGAYVDCLMLIIEAKAMEKEQIIEANADGNHTASIYLSKRMCLDNAEQYYNETYGGK